tara:strand:- start:372 stop:863 length:492 start_codon:yes stop_codon:yes gene_type:complete
MELITLDHIAYRVADRDKTVDFLCSLLGYKVGAEFKIDFDDGSKADCKALVDICGSSPEVFVSEGTPGSIVDDWVKERDGTGGVHHIAYSVENIDKAVKQLRDRGVEFLSDDIIDCPDDNLRQIFTKPQDLLGGIIVELIERGDRGFCQNSVKNLMESTKPEN